MLQNFLWFLKLEYGAYIIGGWSCVCGCAVSYVNILKYAAVNQGNLAFAIALIVSSLLMMAGVYQVTRSVILRNAR